MEEFLPPTPNLIHAVAGTSSPIRRGDRESMRNYAAAKWLVNDGGVCVFDSPEECTYSSCKGESTMCERYAALVVEAGLNELPDSQLATDEHTAQPDATAERL